MQPLSRAADKHLASRFCLADTVGRGRHGEGGFAISIRDHIWERLSTRDGLLLLGMNLVPLVGALTAGWDGLAIMLYYWMETAIIGFWLVVRVAFTPLDPIGINFGGKGLSSEALALFIVAHAGIFMGVHLFLLLGVFGSELRPGRLLSPLPLFADLLFERGFLLPLGVFALVRGLFAVADWRAGRRTGPGIIDFYIRIIVMQFTVLLGGWVFLILMPFGADSAIGALVVLVLFKTGAELLAGPLMHIVENAITRAGEKQRG